MDHRATLLWDGLTVILHEVPRYERSFLAQIHLTRSHDQLFPGFIGGDALGVFDSLIGIQLGAATARFDCPGELPPSVEFRWAGPRITEVHWYHEPD